MSPSFTHLRVHTEFSLVDSLVRVQDLVSACAERGLPAVALTDECNLFAMVKFYRAAEAAGIKPILGADLWLDEPTDRDQPSRFTLLCRDEDGFGNLTELISLAYTDGQHRGQPRIHREWLTPERCQGLIALSGGREGEVGRALVAGRSPAAREALAWWQERFPDAFYLELIRTGREQEEDHIHAAVELAANTATPVVASNDVRFLDRGHFEAHETRVCIQDGRTLDDPMRPRRYSAQQYLKTPEEMAELFSDLPEALENSVEIARRCNLTLKLGEIHLPAPPMPEGETSESYLIAESRRGLEQRLRQIFPAGTDDLESQVRRYYERLDHELDVIISMGFPGYFLIVADFIRWARENDVPVGPGRGSGAGSLVAYALGITDLDPLAYDLLFERFLNPERVSMPDFDVDFCMDGRDRVIEYVAEKYGREKVSQIITYGTMAARAVVRDVGRVFGHGYSYVDRVAKLIPFEVGMTLEKALEEEGELREEYEKDEEIRQLIDRARNLEGLSRQAGKHAGGVVISPTVLTDFTPLYVEPGGENTVTQLDKDDVESAGLVKFDFLGLRTLTIIDHAVKIANRQLEAQGREPVDIDQVPLDDPDTIKLLKECQTTAVFQLESRGMKDLIRRLQPDSFEDVVALVALFRPGPLQSGMVDDFINRKHGRAEVSYPHPDLEPVLEPTYGVILYQEQVMQIARVLADYTLGEADILRRAMGKKKAEEMARQREVFLSGAEKKGVDANTAAYIFDLIEKFAGYGFNKCVHGDTRLVEAHTGEPLTVAEMFRARHSRMFFVHAEDTRGRLIPRKVEDIVWNGRKTVYRLRTAQGHCIRATARHRFRTWQGWSRLADLEVGDRIAAARRLSVETEANWPREELIVLAGLLTEGNTCHPTTLYYYSNESELIEDFVQAASHFPNTVAQVSTRADGRRLEARLNTGRVTRFAPGHQPWNARTGTEIASVPVSESENDKCSGVYQWAQSLGILGKRATEKQVPEVVFRLRDENIALFLGRMWAGDGFIASERQFTPYFATSSHQLAEDVRILLLRLGVPCGVHGKQFRYRGGTRTGYTVHLVGDGAVERFQQRIGPHIVGRDAQLETLRQYVASVARRQTSVDTLPAEIREWVNEQRLKLGYTWKALEEASGVSMKEFQGGGSAKKKGFGRQTIQRLAAFVGSERLEQAANADLFWDRVVAIEEWGKADTYDLTVENDHNYVADGLVTHNSHSAAYALLSYQTAWLKAHHPAAFMASTLSADMDNTDKVVVLIDECRAMDLEVKPPDVNESDHAFGVDRDGAIRYGLGAIKGVGQAAVEVILGEREQNGPFKDLEDFCRRVDLQKVNRRVIEAMIRAGVMDNLGPNRASLTAALPECLQRAEQVRRASEAGQNDMFGLAEPEPAQEQESPAIPEIAEWDELDRLAAEKETLGLYLTGHPIRQFEDDLERVVSARVGTLVTASEPGTGSRSGQRNVRVAGLAVEMRKRGGRMQLTLDDRTGRIEIMLFEDTHRRFQHLLSKDALLVVDGKLSFDEFINGWRITAREITTMDEAREAAVRGLVVEWQADGPDRQLPEALRETLSPFRGGGCRVTVHYRNGTAEVMVPLGEQWQVHPANTLLMQLERLDGICGVRRVYRRALPETETA